MYPMYHLCGGPNRDGIGPWIVSANHAAAFHGHPGVSMGIEAAMQFEWGVGQSRRCIAFPHSELADEVGLELLVYEFGPWL